MVLDDRRKKVREIAETICVSKERVGYILHEELDVKKALCKMGAALAHSRTKKRTRMKISEQCLERFNKNKTYFFFASIYYYGWELDSPLHTTHLAIESLCLSKLRITPLTL